MTSLYNHINLHGLYEAEEVFLLSVQYDYESVPLLHNPLNLLSYRGYGKWRSTYAVLGSDEVKIIKKKM